MKRAYEEEAEKNKNSLQDEKQKELEERLKALNLQFTPEQEKGLLQVHENNAKAREKLKNRLLQRDKTRKHRHSALGEDLNPEEQELMKEAMEVEDQADLGIENAALLAALDEVRVIIQWNFFKAEIIGTIK